MLQRELPSEWLSVQLGDVVSYGKTQKCVLSDVVEDTWVLELEDVEKESSKVLTRKTASERPFKSTKNYFEKGSVLYGKLRPYLNKVVLADQSGVCTTEIIPLNAEPFVLNRYLFYWLKTHDFLSYVTEVSYGVNMPRLGTKDGVAAPMILAPLAEQKVIADKLDTLLAQVDNTKASLERIPEILKRFRQSVLAAAVSGRLTDEWRSKELQQETAEELIARWESNRQERFNKKPISGKKYKKGLSPDIETLALEEIPASWVRVSVSQFAECLDSKRIPVKKSDRASVIGKYPYFGANGEVDRVDDYIFDGDFVLVTEDETFYGREKPIAYRFTGKCWVNNHAHVLQAETKKANDYLCYNLMHFNVIPWLSGTTGRAKLTQAALNILPIGLPPEKEINEIVRRVDELFAYADTVERQVKNALERVSQLTQSILSKAFRGELTAQWRADNPELISGDNSASALLARIQAERAAQVPTKRTRKKATT